MYDCCSVLTLLSVSAMLQERLRHEYVAKQRRMFETDIECVTLGEASVITELKLANDNLRWRLQQKQSQVDAQQTLIADLRRQLEESRHPDVANAGTIVAVRKSGSGTVET
jgi:hypothetical protein